jgi:8-oxo-dGTP pyrophosphatase MutT (NUDIX family)
MPIPINPKAVRYKIAQLFLRMLYGRKWHYISPWHHASVAATVVLTKNGKVLMGKRRGNIEFIGLRDHPGGHVDLEVKEGLIQACVRETYEEMRIKIDPLKITEDKLIDVCLNNDSEYIEHLDARNICLTYIYEVNDKELEDLQDTEESFDFKWFDKNEVEKELRKDIHIIEQRHYERALKALNLKI